MNKGNSLLLGLIVGGVIGGLSILLTTPKSGAALRTELKGTSRELSDRLQNIKAETKDFIHLLEKSTKEGEETVKDFAEDVQKSISIWKKEMVPHQVNIQRELKEIEQTMLLLEEATSQGRSKPTTS